LEGGSEDELRGVTHWYADNPWGSLCSTAGGSPCPGKLTPKTSAIWRIPYQKGGVSFKTHWPFLLPIDVRFVFSHFRWAPSMDLVFSPQCPWGCVSSEMACVGLKQECFPCSRISPSSNLNHPDCLSMAFLPWPPPAVPSLLCVVQAPVLDWGQPWSAAEHLRSTDIRKGSGCAGWHQAQQEPTLCPGSQEIHLNSRRHYALHSQQVKKDYSSTIVSFGVSLPGIYLAVLGSTK